MPSLPICRDSTKGLQLKREAILYGNINLTMSNMKKKIVIAVVIVFVVALVVYMGFGSGNTRAVKIGVAIPLTGNYAPIGEKIRNGLELAKKDIEEKNPGMSVDLVYEDGCLPKDVTTAVQKLINVNKVKVINQFCAIGLVPSLDITEPNKVISVGMAANVSDLLGKKYYFSPNFSVNENARTIADYSVNTLKAKRVAFIYYNTQLGKDYRKYVGERVSELGGQIVADEMTSLDMTDFRTSLLKIKEAKPDVIFVTQLTGALATVIKQTKELGIQAPLVGNYSNEDSSVLSTAGSAAEGFLISSADPAILSTTNGDFSGKYLAQYKVAPDVFASNAYDALHLEFAAHVKCGGDTDCMSTEMHAVKDYKGVSGVITIDKDGFASKPTVFKVVKDGKFEVTK